MPLLRFFSAHLNNYLISLSFVYLAFNLSQFKPWSTCIRYETAARLLRRYDTETMMLVGSSMSACAGLILVVNTWANWGGFGRQIAEHFFCGICGIYTHHRRSTNPHEFGFNIGCLEGVNPYDLESVPVADDGQWDEPTDLFLPSHNIFTSMGVR